MTHFPLFTPGRKGKSASDSHAENASFSAAALLQPAESDEKHHQDHDPENQVTHLSPLYRGIGNVPALYGSQSVMSG